MPEDITPAPESETVELIPADQVAAMKAEFEEQITALEEEAEDLTNKLLEATNELAELGKTGAKGSKSDDRPPSKFMGDYIPEGHPAHKSKPASAGGPQPDYIPAVETFPCPVCDFVGKTAASLKAHNTKNHS